MNWEKYRDQHTNKISGTYLNSGANGLLSLENLENEHNQAKLFMEDPGKYRMDFIFQSTPSIRSKAAKAIGAKDHEVALIQNFSVGINFWVSSLPKLKVLLFEGDYPSLTMPFEQGNFDIHWLQFNSDIELDFDALEEYLDSNDIDLLAISHCQWLNGYLVDLDKLGAICRKHKTLFVVDATQSLGVVPIDVKASHIDVLGASGYKWPLAGFGNGIFYINESTQERFQPTTAGFNSNSWFDGKPKYIPGIKSLEPGHLEHGAFTRLAFALDRIEEIGIDTIREQVGVLMSYLIEKLSSINYPVIGKANAANRAGILSIGSKPGLFKYLLSNGIEVSERGGNIRIGLHYYNTEEDIDKLISALTDFTNLSHT